MKYSKMMANNPFRIRILLFILLTTRALFGQNLDYSKHVVLELEDHTFVNLFGVTGNDEDYYFVPFAHLFQLSKSIDGIPEFSFIRYTSDENTDAKGGILHCLINWEIPKQMEVILQRKLTELHPAAKIRGHVPLAPESNFFIVSNVLSENEKKVLGFGHAPTLPGSKVAVSASLDPPGALLLSEMIKRNGSTDVSFVFEYKIAFQHPTRKREIVIDLEKYLKIYEAYISIAQESPGVNEIGFKYLLQKEVIYFGGHENVSENDPEFAYAQDFALKYLKNIKSDNLRATDRKLLRINLADIQMEFNFPFQVTINLGEWLEPVRNNPSCLRDVNLIDPYFKSREITVMLDTEIERIFKEDKVNSISVSVKKNRKDGKPLVKELLFSRKSFENGDAVKSLNYAIENDNDYLQYEYAVSWMVTGSGLYPENPPWTTTRTPALAIVCPVSPVDILVDASGEELKSPQLAAILLEIEYNYFGIPKKERIMLRATENGLGIATKSIYCDKDQSAIKFRYTFIHKTKGAITTDQILADGIYYLIPQLPKAFDNSASVILEVQDEIPSRAQTNPGAKKIERNNKDYALLFAVSEYQADSIYPDLQNPVTDAEAIAMELSQRYGFRVEVLKNATRTQIKNKLDEYNKKFELKEFDPEGQLFLFFSGHGEFSDGSGFFLPADVDQGDLEATAIAYPIWQPRINNINCKHILVVIDACYSGTFDQSVAMRSGPQKRPGELSDAEKFYQEYLTRATRLYMASGGKEQTPDKSGFAKKLLEGLRLADAPYNLLTAGQLFELYIKQIRPVPLFGEFGKDEAGSSFIFVKR